MRLRVFGEKQEEQPPLGTLGDSWRYLPCVEFCLFFLDHSVVLSLWLDVFMTRSGR